MAAVEIGRAEAAASVVVRGIAPVAAGASAVALGIALVAAGASAVARGIGPEAVPVIARVAAIVRPAVTSETFLAWEAAVEESEAPERRNCLRIGRVAVAGVGLGKAAATVQVVVGATALAIAAASATAAVSAIEGESVIAAG